MWSFSLKFFKILTVTKYLAFVLLTLPENVIYCYSGNFRIGIKSGGKGGSVENGEGMVT